MTRRWLLVLALLLCCDLANHLAQVGLVHAMMLLLLGHDLNIALAQTATAMMMVTTSLALLLRHLYLLLVHYAIGLNFAFFEVC